MKALVRAKSEEDNVDQVLAALSETGLKISPTAIADELDLPVSTASEWKQKVEQNYKAIIVSDREAKAFTPEEHDQLLDAIAAMEEYGGSFAQVIAKALRKADTKNTRKLQYAFPDLISKYVEMANEGDL